MQRFYIKEDPQGYYSALGLDPRNKRNITKKQIKAAFRDQAKLTHPDKTGQPGYEQFDLVHEAYETLSDTKKRYQYDYPHFEYVKKPFGKQTADTARARREQQEKLDESYEKLKGWQGGVDKFFAGLAVTINALLIASVLTGLLAVMAAIVFLPLAISFTFFPSVIEKIPLLASLKLNKLNPVVRGLLGFIALPIALALIVPVVGLGVGAYTTLDSYKEMAVRGKGKALVALAAAVLTTVLLAVCPPAGAATATFGVGGTLAATFGLKSAGAGLWAFMSASLTITAALALNQVKNWLAETRLVKAIKKCFCPTKMIVDQEYHPGEEPSYQPPQPSPPMNKRHSQAQTTASLKAAAKGRSVQRSPAAALPSQNPAASLVAQDFPLAESEGDSPIYMSEGGTFTAEFNPEESVQHLLIQKYTSPSR